MPNAALADAIVAQLLNALPALDLTCLRDRVMVPPPHEQPARPYAAALTCLELQERSCIHTHI